LNLIIRAPRDEDIPALRHIALSAWAPVFRSFAQILGSEIYPLIWPDWRKSQPDDVEALCRDRERSHALVAEVAGAVVGFIGWKEQPQERRGEVQYLAVDPDHQNRGVGTRLNQAALREMKGSGIELAELCAGGDPSHAPARRAYEKAGYTALPLVRYYQKL
jgi:ribosomal protein S18 acetylase RimI-like enzyme